ncbi:MAG: hypothetical protein HYZ33_01400 [Ignavibacteriales bacterium]|nr:hypothetical protein [Ignavibacteriales bacterium]
MKKVSLLIIGFLLLTLGVNNINAQSLEERLQKFGTDYAKGYMGPFSDAFGAALNTGWYNTANVDDGVSIFAGIKLMYMPIPDESKMFKIASPYPPNAIDEVPTAFGENVQKPISNDPSSGNYPAGLGLDFVPMAMPHISIGNIYGTRAMLRYFPATKIGDYGDFEMFGFGLQHSVNRHLPEGTLPVDVAAMFAFQSFKVGSLVDASAFTFGAQASKSFAIVDFYAGLAYETSTMTIAYDAQLDPNNPSNKTHIGFDMPGKNNFRLTGGFSLSLFILKIHADYSLASQPVANVGIGLGW